MVVILTLEVKMARSLEPSGSCLGLSTSLARRFLPQKNTKAKNTCAAVLLALAKSFGWRDLFHVFADQLGHLEHRDGFLAAENCFQRVVSVDVGSLFLVLEPLLLDVGPQFLGDLGARNRLGADHHAESGVRLHRFHECRVRFSFFLCCCHSYSSFRNQNFRYVYSRGPRLLPTFFYFFPRKTRVSSGSISTAPSRRWIATP